MREHLLLGAIYRAFEHNKCRRGQPTGRKRVYRAYLRTSCAAICALANAELIAPKMTSAAAAAIKCTFDRLTHCTLGEIITMVQCSRYFVCSSLYTSTIRRYNITVTQQQTTRRRGAENCAKATKTSCAYSRVIEIESRYNAQYLQRVYIQRSSRADTTSVALSDAASLYYSYIQYIMCLPCSLLQHCLVYVFFCLSSPMTYATHDDGTTTAHFLNINRDSAPLRGCFPNSWIYFACIATCFSAYYTFILVYSLSTIYQRISEHTSCVIKICCAILLHIRIAV